MVQLPTIPHVDFHATSRKNATILFFGAIECDMQYGKKVGLHAKGAVVATSPLLTGVACQPHPAYLRETKVPRKE
jgi:hypothetical protein